MHHAYYECMDNSSGAAAGYTFNPSTGRMEALAANDPRLTARLPKSKVVELPLTDAERAAGKAAMLARWASQS